MKTVARCMLYKLCTLTYKFLLIKPLNLQKYSFFTVWEGKDENELQSQIASTMPQHQKNAISVQKLLLVIVVS